MLGGRGLWTRASVSCVAVSGLYCIAAVAIAVFLPSERDVRLVVLGLLLGYAAVSQVRFEFGMGFVVPEQLVVDSDASPVARCPTYRC